MTEAEILVEIAVRTDRMWSVVQWWASITFGVLVAAHFGAKTLNTVFVTLIVIIYTAFSVMVAQVFMANGITIVAAMGELVNFSEDGVLSAVGESMLTDSGTARGVSLGIAIGLSYLATVFYIIYAYRTHHKNKSRSFENGENDT